MFQVRCLRLREGKQHAQGHTASGCDSQVLLPIFQEGGLGDRQAWGERTQKEGYAQHHPIIQFLLPRLQPSAPLPTICRKARWWASPLCPGSQAWQGSLCSSFFLPFSFPPSPFPSFLPFLTFLLRFKIYKLALPWYSSG